MFNPRDIIPLIAILDSAPAVASQGLASSLGDGVSVYCAVPTAGQGWGLAVGVRTLETLAEEAEAAARLLLVAARCFRDAKEGPALKAALVKLLPK